MSIMSQLNQPVLYLICGGIILFVALVCVVFLVRAYRAGGGDRHGPYQTEADHYGQRDIHGAAECRHPARRHRAVGQPRHALALAAALGHRRAAL